MAWGYKRHIRHGTYMLDIKPFMYGFSGTEIDNILL